MFMEEKTMYNNNVMNDLYNAYFNRICENENAKDIVSKYLSLNKEKEDLKKDFKSRSSIVLDVFNSFSTLRKLYATLCGKKYKGSARDEKVYSNQKYIKSYNKLLTNLSKFNSAFNCNFVIDDIYNYEKIKETSKSISNLMLNYIAKNKQDINDINRRQDYLVRQFKILTREIMPKLIEESKDDPIKFIKNNNTETFREDAGLSDIFMNRTISQSISNDEKNSIKNKAMNYVNNFIDKQK
jgi:hypothetical protein